LQNTLKYLILYVLSLLVNINKNNKYNYSFINNYIYKLIDPNLKR